MQQPHERSKDKDIWDKLEILGKIAASIGIPVVLVVAGYFVQKSLAEVASRERRSDNIVEVASDVLSADPQSYAGRDAIRSWAIKVINKYSEVPLDDDAISELDKSPLVPPRRPRNRSQALSLEIEADDPEMKKFYRDERITLYQRRFEKQLLYLEKLKNERNTRRYLLALFDAGLFAEFGNKLEKSKKYYELAINHPLADDPNSRTRIGRQIGEEARRHLEPILESLSTSKPLDQFSPTIP